ncbi:HSP20-like chaperone [Parasitella parasitica]|nr:HSP20-like chaperone [Parasitella parasitica]
MSEETADGLTLAERAAKEEQERLEKQREEEEQAQLPYTWRQTLSNVDISIPVPKGTRARDLDIVLKKDRLKVALKNQPSIVEGTLCQAIKVDDSVWTLDDQKEVSLRLEKVNQMQWWDNVIEGAPKINTKKIQPENSNLSDLDGETRAMVEKMMFDQRQKAVGKPDSDTLKKEDMFKKFKEQHPEMDFSNAKFTE